MTVLAADRTDTHLALFSAPAFHALNLAPGERHVRVDHQVDGRLLGSLCGRLDRATGRLVCGASAPFGGLDLTPAASTSPTALAPLIDDLVTQLHDHHGVRRLEVRARPAAHGAQHAALETALLAAGFTVAHTAVNQHIDLETTTHPEDHLAALPKKRRWALRRDLEAGYAHVEVAGSEAWHTVHAIVDGARLAKVRPPWLAPAYLDRLRTAFPGRIHGRLLHLDGQPLAAAVVYAVASGVELLAAWGDAGPGAGGRSPMNLLAHHLVADALARGSRVLDLGISSEPDGTPNTGLIHFKRSVGAQTGHRLTLTKDLP
ncbi:MAG: hypothetical protein JWM31_659 [Solirubrobacterales bacterium]|nr:hypothetical protein [Solirubrobacterales bacterium]